MRFRNLEPPFEPHPLSAVLRWAVGDRLRGKRRSAPRRFLEMRVVDPDRALIASGAPSLTWVGHATWFVKLGGQTILTDPVWSESLGPGITRNVRPGIGLEEIRPLDEPPRLLEKIRQLEQLPAERVWVAAIGESRAL
jgi:Beta-lactamase superfamily domain